MKEESIVEIARMAVDMTIALMNDKHGHLNHLKNEGKIPQGSSPMAIYDEVFAHLYASVKST